MDVEDDDSSARGDVLSLENYCSLYGSWEMNETEYVVEIGSYF